MRGLRFGILAAVVLLGASTAAYGQGDAPVTSKDKLAWDQGGVTPAVAQTFTYRAYIDALPGVPVANVVCTVHPQLATDASCLSDFPAATPGVEHTITLTAGDGTVESSKSNSLTFRFTLVQTPSGFRIVRLP
jgi:hypothetical protein